LLPAWVLASPVRLNGHENRVNVFQTGSKDTFEERTFFFPLALNETVGIAARTGSLWWVMLSTAATINREPCISGRGFIEAKTYN
jgi:hypothetical protein